MNITIHDLDVQAYEALCVRAAIEGRTVGEVINDAIRCYLAQPTSGKGSLRTLEPILLPPGNENLSSEIDQIVYGASR